MCTGGTACGIVKGSLRDERIGRTTGCGATDTGTALIHSNGLIDRWGSLRLVVDVRFRWWRANFGRNVGRNFNPSVSTTFYVSVTFYPPASVTFYSLVSITFYPLSSVVYLPVRVVICLPVRPIFSRLLEWRVDWCFRSWRFTRYTGNIM